MYSSQIDDFDKNKPMGGLSAVLARSFGDKDMYLTGVT
jgi:hypothetical protein